MAEVAGARTLIFHVTAAEAVRELADARGRGQVAFGEAVPAVPAADHRAVDEPVSGTALDFGPPLREESSTAARSGPALADGMIDIISTDHGPRRRSHGADGT